MTGGSQVRDVHATVYVDARARRAAAAVRTVRPDPDADAGFVGRTQELAQLLALLAPRIPTADAGAGSADDTGGGAAAGVVVVSAVAGAPGVGKTALAQAAARAAVARGWFPGGAVTVDLHGYDPDPFQVVWPAQLYAGLLHALGVPVERVPPTESAQATVYHRLLDQLAAADRPVLLVLDNVGDTDQVADALPRGIGGHRVLITSRHTLAALPHARLLDLHVLEAAAAVELLTLGLHRRRPSDTRVADDPDVASRLVELCGRLPLAVQIVTALLGDEPGRSVAELADELTDETHRLRALDYDRRWAVRAAFDLSYRRLDPATAALFDWLAAAPGPDVGLAVAAAVADQEQSVTRAGLRVLCRAHLLDQQPTTSGVGPRWRMHDLLRLYATEHLTPQLREVGFARALVQYLRTTNLARRRFTALPADAASVPPGFATPAEAMDWVLTERAGLVAAVAEAADTYPDAAAALAAELVPFLDRARLLADWVTVATAAVHADTSSSPDRTATAGAWNNLGLALREVRRFDEAITAHHQAREILRETGDRHSEGSACNSFGLALREVRRFDEAIAAHQQAREIFRETGDRHNEATAWINLGNALLEVQRLDEAITAYEQAREIFRETGGRHNEATAWNNLGNALRQVRRFDEAITAHQQAREIFRETGDRYGEGTAWHNLGLALARVRRFDEAITAYEANVAICIEFGDRYRHALTLEALGGAHVALGHPEPARRVWVAAIGLLTAVGAADEAKRIRGWLAALDDGRL